MLQAFERQADDAFEHFLQRRLTDFKVADPVTRFFGLQCFEEVQALLVGHRYLLSRVYLEANRVGDLPFRREPEGLHDGVSLERLHEAHHVCGVRVVVRVCVAELGRVVFLEDYVQQHARPVVALEFRGRADALERASVDDGWSLGEYRSGR